jgi:hypothetical protein
MRMVVALLFVAACGGSSSAPANPANTGEPVADQKTRGPSGTTEMSNLSWGATADAILAEYPQATKNDEGGLWFAGSAENKPAVTVFNLDDEGLQSIRIQFTDTFPSMTECMTVWTTLRTDFDGRYGASQSDNGAAYWSTGQAEVEVDCNPNDAGAAELLLVYANPATAN